MFLKKKFCLVVVEISFYSNLRRYEIHSDITVTV